MCGAAMILELALLDVIPGNREQFESDFLQAEPLISAAKGYLGHELNRCIEDSNRYVLLVKWETLQDHTEGFRQSADYNKWKELLHHHYDPFPTVEHFEL